MSGTNDVELYWKVFESGKEFFDKIEKDIDFSKEANASLLYCLNYHFKTQKNNEKLPENTILCGICEKKSDKMITAYTDMQNKHIFISHCPGDNPSYFKQIFDLFYTHLSIPYESICKYVYIVYKSCVCVCLYLYFL